MLSRIPSIGSTKYSVNQSFPQISVVPNGYGFLPLVCSLPPLPANGVWITGNDPEHILFSSDIDSASFMLIYSRRTIVQSDDRRRPHAR